MEEDFANFDDASLSVRSPIITAVEPEPEGHWSEKFRDMDRYDWSDPTWIEQNKGPFAFLPIPLTQSYFMIVSPERYGQMTKYPNGSPKKFHAKIDRDEDGNIRTIYGCRSGKGDEPSIVRSHREILDCLTASEDVDHVNGWGLDNRSNETLKVNLVLVSTAENMYNNVRSRRVNTDLLRGVEKRSKDGREGYGWIRARRVGKQWIKDRKTGQRVLRRVAQIYRSPEFWDTPEEAHTYYLEELERLSNGRKQWAHNPTTVHFPVFPPLMDSEPLGLSKDEYRAVLEDVPF